jgi:hypothetical protein
MVGKQLQCWWHGDSRFYSGIIVAYDGASGRHVVEYGDSATSIAGTCQQQQPQQAEVEKEAERDWEFIHLGFQPALVEM